MVCFSLTVDRTALHRKENPLTPHVRPRHVLPATGGVTVTALVGTEQNESEKASNVDTWPVKEQSV